MQPTELYVTTSDVFFFHKDEVFFNLTILNFSHRHGEAAIKTKGRQRSDKKKRSVAKCMQTISGEPAMQEAAASHSEASATEATEGIPPDEPMTDSKDTATDADSSIPKEADESSHIRDSRIGSDTVGSSAAQAQLEEGLHEDRVTPTDGKTQDVGERQQSPSGIQCETGPQEAAAAVDDDDEVPHHRDETSTVEPHSVEDGHLESLSDPAAVVIESQPLTQHAAPVKPPPLSLDIIVGTWRDVWPRDVTCLINVDKNVVVRYFRTLRKVDLVRMVQKPQPHTDKRSVWGHPVTHSSPHDGGDATYDLSLEAKVCDSFWVSSLPNISSLHHFTLGQTAAEALGASLRTSASKGSPGFHSDEPIATQLPAISRAGAGRNGILCVADDMKRCIVFGITQDDKIEQLGATSLPIKASHVVPFMYRGISYFLTYYSPTGEYGVIPFSTLTSANGMPQLVARGNFRAGWTDILWKGTHHVRCTRQKFFCYNHTTGETVFECVWVRGASGTSSICSAEHTTLAAPDSKRRSTDDGDSELSAALRQKACIVVPLHIGGNFAAMLYSHSSFTSTAGRRGSTAQSFLTGRRQSTSRMPIDPSTIGGVYTRSYTMYNVTDAATLMLRKRVFAHAEPWTHFCMLSDYTEELREEQIVSAPSSLLLCYSAVSGEVWVNAIGFVEPGRVARDVTVYEAAVNQIILSAAAPSRFKSQHPPLSPTSGVGTAGGLSHTTLHGHGNHHSNGVDVHGFLREQATRKSPFDHPLDADGDPLYTGGRRNDSASQASRAHNGAGPTPPPAGARPPLGSAARLHATARDSSTASPNLQGSARRSTPVQGRPSSSSLSLTQRLNGLPPTTGDYRRDIANVIGQISTTDFNDDAPYSRMALSNVPRLPPYDARLASLDGAAGGSRAHVGSAGSRGSAGASGNGSEEEYWQPPKLAAGGDETIHSSSSPHRRNSPRHSTTPWRPAAAPGVTIPAPPGSCAYRFEQSYTEHVNKEIAALRVSDEALSARLYQRGIDSRKVFQEKELQRIYKDLESKLVDSKISSSPEGRQRAKEAVERLSVADVALRKKRFEEQEDLKSKNEHKNDAGHEKLSPARVQEVAERMHDHSISVRLKHMEALRNKVLAGEGAAAIVPPSPPSHRKSESGPNTGATTTRSSTATASPLRSGSPQKLSMSQQAALNKRLDDEAVAKRATKMAFVAEQMRSDFRRHACEAPFGCSPRLLDPPHLDSDDIKLLSERLFRNEPRGASP